MEKVNDSETTIVGSRKTLQNIVKRVRKLRREGLGMTRACGLVFSEESIPVNDQGLWQRAIAIRISHSTRHRKAILSHFA